MTSRSDKVSSFKNLLRNYRYVCRRLDELTIKLNELWAHLGARPKGIDPSKERTHAYVDPAVAHEISMLISDLEAKIKPWRDKKQEVEYLLGQIESPCREQIIAVYVDGNTIREVAQKYRLSKSGLDARMNQAIKKALIDW